MDGTAPQLWMIYSMYNLSRQTLALSTLLLLFGRSSILWVVDLT